MTHIDPDGAAYIWRLAMLMTDDPRASAWILSSVVATHPDLDRLAESRRDRMVVLRARQWISKGDARTGATDKQRQSIKRAAAAGPLEGGHPLTEVLDGTALQLWRAVRGLERPLFETWVMVDALGMSELEASRSMDCSRTVVGQRIAAAHEAIMPLLGDDAADALASLRASIDQPPPEAATAMADEARRRLVRRRRRTSILIAVILVSAMALVVWSMIDVYRSTERGETFKERMPVTGDEPPPVFVTPSEQDEGGEARP